MVPHACSPPSRRAEEQCHKKILAAAFSLGLQEGVHHKQEIVKEWKRVLKLKAKKSPSPTPFLVEFPSTPQELDLFHEAYHGDPPCTNLPSPLSHEAALRGSMRQKRSASRGELVPAQSSSHAAAPSMDAMAQQLQMMMGGMNNMFQAFGQLLSGEPQIHVLNRGRSGPLAEGGAEEVVALPVATMKPEVHTPAPKVGAEVQTPAPNANPPDPDGQVDVVQRALAARRRERELAPPEDVRKRPAAKKAPKETEKGSPEKKAKAKPEAPEEPPAASQTRPAAKKVAKVKGSGSLEKQAAEDPEEPATPPGRKWYARKKHKRGKFTAFAIHSISQNKQIVQLTTTACADADLKITDLVAQLNGKMITESEAIAAVNALKGGT